MTKVVPVPSSVFSWIETYEAIADALRERKDDQAELLELFSNISGGVERDSIDPFTFFTSFNRGIVIIDRHSMVADICKTLGVDAGLPHDYLGIPTANHELWQYFDSTPEGVEDCWNLFELALDYADAQEPAEDLYRELGEAFDKVHAQENITKANLTRALYWVRPKAFLPLGGKTRDFLHDRYGLNLQYSLTGAQYLRVLEEASAVVEEPFYAIAAKAFRSAHADSWWPLERDYNPYLMEEQWELLLADESIVTDDTRLALQRMREYGGEATPEELAAEYGKGADFYRTAMHDFTKAVCARLGQKGYKGSQWPIALVGQAADENRKGDYVWKFRPELAAALNRYFG